MDIKLIMGLIAALLAIAAIIPYIVTIIKGQTRPHLFSWAIWALLNAIAFSAQLAGGAGPGAWVTGISIIGNFVICYFAWRCYHTLSINRVDWLSLIFALTAIPLWLITNQPLVATVIVTAITIAAYIPTMKKTWHDSRSENLLSNTIHGSKALLGIVAIVDYNLTTVLYPAALVLANIVMIGLMLRRR